MAPKATRNPGDKTEEAKRTRVGRDKGEPAGVNKRLTSIVGIENLSEIEDSNNSYRETRENELDPPAEGKQFQTQQSDQIEQPERQNGEGTVNTSGPAAEKRDLHKSLRSPKRWGKTTGKDPQLVDWGKDSSNKFYSLTEESDFSSIDHSSGESEDSVTSEAGNKSSSNELTVRQVR
ncbi:hypothetical protein NDU88_006509 [Pleurodeles waltl]|uniref:Uncharacterized protein n=1 Tax=Pleurodeles waltl TaxID=8319 RepID=A0AAV7MDM4_PLEWA|nr:hypothetical protein NDU88_006509 [Pleurodeles waltl]